MESSSEGYWVDEESIAVRITKIEFGWGFGIDLSERMRKRSGTIGIEGSFAHHRQERCAILVCPEIREDGDFMIFPGDPSRGEGVGHFTRWSDDDAERFGDGIRYSATVVAEPIDLSRVREFVQLPHTRDSQLIATLRVPRRGRLRSLQAGETLPIVEFGVHKIMQFQPMSTIDE